MRQPKLEPTADFWAAGGTSIAASLVANNLAFNPQLLFTFPTARKLARYLETPGQAVAEGRHKITFPTARKLARYLETPGQAVAEGRHKIIFPTARKLARYLETLGRSDAEGRLKIFFNRALGLAEVSSEVTNCNSKSRIWDERLRRVAFLNTLLKSCRIRDANLISIARYVDFECCRKPGMVTGVGTFLLL